MLWVVMASLMRNDSTQFKLCMFACDPRGFSYSFSWSDLVSCMVDITEEGGFDMSPFFTSSLTCLNGIEVTLQGVVGGYINSQSYPTINQAVGEAELEHYCVVSSCCNSRFNCYIVQNDSQRNSYIVGASVEETSYTDVDLNLSKVIFTLFLGLMWKRFYFHDDVLLKSVCLQC